jgi:phytol kinase
MASYDLYLTFSVLCAGILLYTSAEMLRMEGRTVAVLSFLTIAASRDRERGKFVMGPVTLGIGAMLALLLYPAPAASIAIFALAFGDGIASLAGKLWGRIRVPFTGGKTVAGSVACFIVVFFITMKITGNAETALVVACAGTIFELVSPRELDNIIMPLGTGFVAAQLIG